MTGPGEVKTDAIPPVIARTLGPGAVVAGRYRLQARLGTGGGGTVWRCFDDKLATVVALKIVSSGGDLERWRREVAMARRIASRNVCRVHDLGETAELRYVTMELVEGDSLRARIARGVPAAVARDLFAQIVAGAAAIHAAGVVHRDLKPENVVVAHDGRAVIVDFGLAREPRVTASAPAVTSAGAVLGTPRYMSPEQAAGEIVDARTDVWALGLIGHELVTGALPRPDQHGRSIDPAVDAAWRGLGAVLRRCLGLLPDERFADARQLEHALAGLTRRRSRVRIALVAMAAVAATAAPAVISLRGADSDEPTASAPRPRMQQLTSAEPKRWPDDAPVSIAMSPDASQFAYTTALPRLLVRPVAAGSAVEWSMPALEKPRSRPGDAAESVFTSTAVVGWFSDGSLALLGAERNGGHQLHRVFADGRTQLVVRYAHRFIAAATAIGDRVALAVDNRALSVMPVADGAVPREIAALGAGERVLAIAWSPDGARLAYLRLPGGSQDASIAVVPATGGERREVWRGPLTALAGQLLAWLDEDRLAFATNDLPAARARLFTLDTRGRRAEHRDEWPATYLGAGSAARGTLLVLRGAASHAVQIGDRSGWRLARLHDRAVRARQLAGWTSDGRVVFAVGEPGKERIVRAALGQPLEDWPGTHAGVDSPDTLAGDDLIAHRTDPANRQIVLERITPAGKRSEIARLSAGAAGCEVARCAGDRAGPCFVGDDDGRTVRWTELDPGSGARGSQIHQRLLRDSRGCSAALSPDGRLLAVVDGGPTVTIVERTSGEQEVRSAGEGAALHSVGFAADGVLWATATGYQGRRTALISFIRLDNGRISSSPSLRGNSRADALRWYARPSPSPDGKQVAVATLDLELEVWRADDL